VLVATACIVAFPVALNCLPGFMGSGRRGAVALALNPACRLSYPRIANENGY
jgi:hypothetical protein